ncbi:unnamed protein product [Vicia faba]|uniref:Uncharacterized protein n=1 Tax=Vicia faba TaxID=3906 RepID=A0AAV0ZIV9_VICFA|nr:unnamed protein product [Vicia faba]
MSLFNPTRIFISSLPHQSSFHHSHTNLHLVLSLFSPSLNLVSSNLLQSSSTLHHPQSQKEFTFYKSLYSLLFTVSPNHHRPVLHHRPSSHNILFPPSIHLNNLYLRKNLQQSATLIFKISIETPTSPSFSSKTTHTRNLRRQPQQFTESRKKSQKTDKNIIERDMYLNLSGLTIFSVAVQESLEHL